MFGADKSPEIIYEEDDVRKKLNGVLDKLIYLFPSDRLEFGKAADVLDKTVSSMKTASSVVSAMHNFGKTPAAALLTRGKNRAAIPVQPTALARRKSHFGGRRCLISGRIFQFHTTLDHIRTIGQTSQYFYHTEPQP